MTTRHIEMCKRKFREMIDLVEKYMVVVARDGDEKENNFVANNGIDNVKKTNCSLNNFPILDLPCVTKRSYKCKNQKQFGET